MDPALFKLLNFTLTPGKIPYMKLVMDLLGESTWFFPLKLHKHFFGLFQYFSNVSWPTFVSNDEFGLVDRTFSGCYLCTHTLHHHYLTGNKGDLETNG